MQNLPRSHGDLTGSNYIPWQPGDTDLSHDPASPWKCQPQGEVTASQLGGVHFKVAPYPKQKCFRCQGGEWS